MPFYSEVRSFWRIGDCVQFVLMLTRTTFSFNAGEHNCKDDEVLLLKYTKNM